MVLPAELTIKSAPPDVHVVGCKRIVRWLAAQPPRLSPEEVAIVFDHARRDTTWRARKEVRLLLDDADLADEVHLMTDRYTDRPTFDALAAAGLLAQVFVNHVSRLAVDPKRLPDGEEPMAKIGMGAVYRVTSGLRPLRDEDPDDDHRLMEDRFHTPAMLVRIARETFAGMPGGVGENCPFAELERSPEHVHTYRMTPIGLWNARAAGLEVEQVQGALRRWSRFGVPDSLLAGMAGRGQGRQRRGHPPPDPPP